MPPKGSFEERYERYKHTLSGRIHAAFNQKAGEVVESLGITEPFSWSYNASLDIVTGTVGAYGDPGVPLSPEQANALKDVYKTIFEGKSLGEWFYATPTHVKDGSIYFEGDPVLGVSFKQSTQPPSFLAELFGVQSLSSPLDELMNNPVKEMMEDLEQLLLDAAMRRALEASGVELEDGDTLSMTLNGEGEIAIDTNGTSIGGATDDEIIKLSAVLSEKLNETEVGEGKKLGNALLELLAKKMGVDLETIQSDPNFSISFSFVHNAKTGKNEIIGARLDQVNSQILEIIAPER